MTFIRVIRITSVKSSIGIITHQGHISQVNANDHWVTHITSIASCDAKKGTEGGLTSPCIPYFQVSWELWPGLLQTPSSGSSRPSCPGCKLSILICDSHSSLDCNCQLSFVKAFVKGLQLWFAKFTHVRAATVNCEIPYVWTAIVNIWAATLICQL